MLDKKRRIESQQRAGHAVGTRRAPTLRQYGETWLHATLASRVENGRLAPATWRNYRDRWVKHVEPDLGHHRMDALSPSVLRAWLHWKAVEGRGGKPYAPRTVQAIHGTLRKALNDAVRDGVIPSNPMDRVEGPSLPRRQARSLSREEARLLVEAVRGDEHEALWTVLLHTGLRIGEARALRWSSIDLERRLLTVDQAIGDLPTDMAKGAKAGRRRGPRRAKTDSSHAAVPLTSAAIAALRMQRTKVAERRLAARYWEDHDAVFPSAIGTWLDPANVAKRWRKVAAAAELADVRLHDLRHSAASLMLAAGVPMKVVQEVLRHARLATTADLYTHVLPEVSQDAADRLHAHLNDPPDAALQ